MPFGVIFSIIFMMIGGTQLDMSRFYDSHNVLRI